MSITRGLELRHHDIVTDSLLKNLRSSFPMISMTTRQFEEHEIYDEGVLPPMITLMGGMNAIRELIEEFPAFFDALTEMIDKIRSVKEPGFYDSKGNFSPSGSLAIFIRLDSGTKLKFYIKESCGDICRKAVSSIPRFLDKYDNWNEMESSTSLGLLAIYEHDQDDWKTVGF